MRISDWSSDVCSSDLVGVGVLQIVDQLLEILDGVDVVVRRGRDEAHGGGRVPGLRDPGLDLASGQLAALAGLGALGPLVLDVVGVGGVLRRNPEQLRRHLLDGSAPPRESGRVSCSEKGWWT